MQTKHNKAIILLLLIMTLSLGACSDASVPAVNQPASDNHADEDPTQSGALRLPPLTAVTLDGAKLRVVATTSLIGDVVTQVGGEAIDLMTLMGPGQDPHSYEPGAAELTAVAHAHVIFVNGWNLEEGLENDLEAIGGDIPIVPVSANLEPLAFGETVHAEDEHEEEEPTEEHNHAGADPHVWFSIYNVEQWVHNIRDTLSTLDPNNAAIYNANATAYLGQLADLQTYVTEKLAAIPPEQRVLVTNHGAFSYFARDYDFEVLGTVIPGFSTLAEPSAADLADLIRAMRAEGVCTLFTETTVSDTLAQTAAAELDNCATVRVLPLYTGALGTAGSGADSYIGFFRTTVDTIVQGLVE